MKRFVICIALALTFCLGFGVLIGNVTSGTASAATLKTTAVQINRVDCGPDGGKGLIQFFSTSNEIVCYDNTGYISGHDPLFNNMVRVCSGNYHVVVGLDQDPFFIILQEGQCANLDPNVWITAISASLPFTPSVLPTQTK